MIIRRNEIEEQSMKIIDNLAGNPDICIEEKEIRSRIVHTSGDPELYWKVIISKGVIDSAIEALSKKANIITDVKMVEAGIRKKWLKERGIKHFCAVDKKEVFNLAQKTGRTRSAIAVRSLKILFPGSIILIGNAPTALFEILDIVNKGNGPEKLPALIVGVPVGFVGAAESKKKLAEQNVVPYITLPSTRGGSNIASAIMNALINVYMMRENPNE
ncbi:MAG: precorrin-8X methylmutase [Candidatus Humimicrobiaceae bacterium]